MSGLTDEEWREFGLVAFTMSDGDPRGLMDRIIAARTRAVEQELTQVAEANRRRAVAAEQRLAELEAAVLALADEWDDPDPERGDPDRADALRALVSDPTALDRVRQEAVEAALAPIEGLYGGEPPPVFITGTKIVRATARRPDLGGIEVTESLLRVKDVRGAVAAARDAAKEAGR